MRGIWEKQGSTQIALGNESMEMEVYTWRIAQKVGRLTIPFYCVPEEIETPRRFYCRPVLDAWLNRRTPGKFLDQACRLGMRILTQMESALHSVADDTLPGDEYRPAYDGKAPPKGAYEFYQALFRNRLAGHLAPKRNYRSAMEFFDADNECIVPGMELQKNVRSPKSANVILNDLQSFLKKSETTSTDHSSTTTSNPNSADHLIPIHLFPQRTELDRLLVVDADRDIDYDVFCRALAHVSQALITDFNLSQAQPIIEENREEYRDFLNRLFKGWHQRQRKKRQFDKWLKTQREHGFLRLILGGNKLKDTDREAARERAKTYYRTLLWGAYQAMSRCFGALMLVVWIDFTDSKLISANPVEATLFRQVNAPLLWVAGLPLAFLTTSQLRWVVSPLVALWSAEKFDPVSYDRLTELLALYGCTSEQRRQLDRAKKAKQRGKVSAQREMPGRKRGSKDLKDADAVVSLEQGSEQTNGRTGDKAVMDPEIDLDDISEFPPLLDKNCPECRGVLSQVGKPQCRGEWIVVDVECEDCGHEGSYRVQGP